MKLRIVVQAVVGYYVGRQWQPSLCVASFHVGDKSFGGGKGDVFTLIPLAHSNMINVL